MRARLDAIEAAAWQAKAVTPAPLEAHEQTPRPHRPGVAPEQSAVASEAESVVPAADDKTAAPGDDAGAMPPPLPQAEPGFEERIGTRWVVWVGGLTLALGGFFMVRYSIDAGLLDPACAPVRRRVRARAAGGHGEWTRRKESIPAIEALPIANIRDPHRRRHRGGVRDRLCRLRAVWFPRAGDRVYPARLVALGTLAAALLHGPALAGLGIAAAFVTPILVSSQKPDFWALYIYLAIVTAAAFALARIRLWRWLAVTTIALALLWALPCLKFDPPLVGPYAFHVAAGFVLAALLVVCGFMFGPQADEGRIEPISSGSLAAYLLGATMIVLASSHADAAIIVFAVLVAGAVIVAWRAPAATGAVAAAAAFIFVVFAEWAVRGNPDMLVLPGGPLPGIGGPAPTEAAVTLHLVTAALFAGMFGAAGFLAQGRSVRRHHPGSCGRPLPCVHTAGAIGRALRPYRASRPLDPVCNSGGGACGGLWRGDRSPGKRGARPGLRFRSRCLRPVRSALALAFTFALEKGWLTIALSLMSMGTA